MRPPMKNVFASRVFVKPVTFALCSCATCKTLQTLAHRLVLCILFIQQNETESRKRTTRYVMTSCGWTVPRKWEPLDTELPKAILQVVAGPLGREMLRKQESMHAMGETLTGRAALWSSHQRFKTERGVPSQVEKSKLTSLKLECDHELYLDSLDAVLVMFRKVPDDVLLLALVETPLRKVKQFAHEFVFNDRAGLESTEKSFAYLNDAARRAAQRKRAELVRDALTDAPKAAPIKDMGKGMSKGGDAENEKAMPKAPDK